MMGNEDIQAGNEPEYPREIYEPVLTPSMDLDAYLKQELTISYFDTDGDHEVQTCYGDIKLTIDALMDYTQMLGTVCAQWRLEGFHRANYEYHMDRLRKFAGKLQAAIGYDYAATLEKCRKKQKRKERNDDIGEDGITLAARRRKAPGRNSTVSKDAPDKNDAGKGGPPDDGIKEETSGKKDTGARRLPGNRTGQACAVAARTEKQNVPGPGDAAQDRPSTETGPASSAEDAMAYPENSYRIDSGQLQGGHPMEKNGLRTALEGHLDTLKRNLAVVSLEELKTKYKKPFEELQHNISATATAYVKQVTLENLRIRSDLAGEAQPIIQAAIDQSGLLQRISEAAFQKQDIAEFDRLALELKEQINLALAPFYDKHMRLYMERTPPGTPPKAAEFYNEATGCIWRDGAWTPMKVSNTAVLLPIKDIPKAAA